MVCYPDEWHKYLITGKNRMFMKDTPAEIIEKAKEINEKVLKLTGKYYFSFESEAENN